MRFDTLHVALAVALTALTVLVAYLILRPQKESLTLSRNAVPPHVDDAARVPHNTTPPQAEVVLFHSRGCGHCVRMMPTWKECVKELTGKVRFVEVEDQEAMRYGIRGFPTIRFYPNGHHTTNNFVEYRGDRSKNSIEKFALSGGKEM